MAVTALPNDWSINSNYSEDPATWTTDFIERRIRMLAIFEKANFPDASEPVDMRELIERYCYSLECDTVTMLYHSKSKEKVLRAYSRFGIAAIQYCDSHPAIPLSAVVPRDIYNDDSRHP